MFDLKLQFLEDENFALRRQLASLQKAFAVESEANQKSLVCQLTRVNQELQSELQRFKDELLMEREAREIQRAEHEQIVSQLNRSIFELNQQLGLLEDVVREDKRFQYQPNCIEKLFREKLYHERCEVYHNYADPVMFFQVMESILEALDDRDAGPPSPTSERQILDTAEKKEIKPSDQYPASMAEQLEANPDNSNEGENSTMRIQVQSKWAKERSSLHFLRTKKIRDLHLDLRAAKIVQQNYIKAQEKASGSNFSLNTNVDLLRKSYVELVGEHQNLKRKNRLLGRYIQQLQSRNQLLLRTRISPIHRTYNA